MSNSDQIQPQPQSMIEPINTSSVSLPSGEEILSAIREFGLACQKLADLAAAVIAVNAHDDSSPTPPIILSKIDIISSRKKSRSRVDSIRGVQGGEVNESARQLTAAWNDLRKTRFGLPADRTTTDAKPWITRRLTEHSQETLIRCIERYFSEQREGAYLCAVRNFFGSKAYYEAYLADDWTAPKATTSRGEKAIDLSVGGDYWGKQQ